MRSLLRTDFGPDLDIANSLAHPERREFLATVLDYFRLEYAIHSENYLLPNRLKELEKRFREQLKAPWTLDADEELAAPSVIRLDPLHRSARLSNKSMGPASALGKYIKHVAMQSEVDPNVLRGGHYRDFILRLMCKLKDADYLFEETARNASNEEVPVFRLRIEKILWKLGDGETVRPDPIKRRSYKDQSSTPNAFFREIYRRDFSESKRLAAADHTGQLGVDARQDREDRFRADWYLDQSKKVLDERQDSQRVDQRIVLFANYGAGGGHRWSERRSPAKCAPQRSQLRAALRPGGPKRPRSPRFHLLLGFLRPRPPLLPAPD